MRTLENLESELIRTKLMIDEELSLGQGTSRMVYQTKKGTLEGIRESIFIVALIEVGVQRDLIEEHIVKTVSKLSESRDEYIERMEKHLSGNPYSKGMVQYYNSAIKVVNDNKEEPLSFSCE